MSTSRFRPHARRRRLCGWIAVPWLVSTLALGQEAPLGAPAAFDLGSDPHETVRLAAGTVLHQATARRTPALARIDLELELPVLERRGPWSRVRYDDTVGWVLADDPSLASLLTSLPDRLPPSLRPAGLEPHRLATVFEHLGDRTFTDIVGRHRIVTDVDDPALRARLAAIAGHLDDAFARRYGIPPPPPADDPGAAEMIVVLDQETTYRGLVAADPTLAGLGSLGHAGGGLAVLFAGRRPSGHVETSMVHELTHLTSRRALGLKLPIWLEEGLAEDLSYTAIDDAGQLVLGSLSRVPPVRTQREIAGGFALEERHAGGRAALRDLRAGWSPGSAPRLAELLTMPRDDFLGDDRALHYALAGFFVRYLLDGGDPGLAAGFRAYLDAVSRGDAADAAQLGAHLAKSWDDLELALVKWLHSSAAKTGAEPPSSGGAS